MRTRRPEEKEKISSVTEGSIDHSQRYQRLLETTNAVPWEVDLGTFRYTYVGPQAVKLLGYPVEDWYRRGFWVRHILPEDREFATGFCRSATERGEDHQFEYRMVAADGRVVWLHDIVCLGRSRGEVTTLYGFLIDITSIKETEAALRVSEAKYRDLTGRVLTAQEEERRRVARDLHDDFSQRLARLAIELAGLEEDLREPAPELVTRAETIRDELSSLSSDLHTVSHQLHPAILDELGLVSAIESECERVMRSEGIRVAYTSGGVPSSLPRDIAIGIYRVTQEALRNAVTHAQATEIRVSISAVDEGLFLSVMDNGIGFERSKDQLTTGIGLAGMRERIRLIDGRMSVTSEPGRGTSVEVYVPLERIQ